MNEIIFGQVLTQEHHDYLIWLRDSGETNMWGASPYIERQFGVSHKEANSILLEWINYMSNYDDQYEQTN
jgi:uncharacterized protein YciI